MVKITSTDQALYSEYFYEVIGAPSYIYIYVYICMCVCDHYCVNKDDIYK